VEIKKTAIQPDDILTNGNHLTQCGKEGVVFYDDILVTLNIDDDEEEETN